jgi:hypothetical protein
VPQPLPYEPKASKRHAKVEAKPADLDDGVRTFTVTDNVEGTTSVAATNPNAPDVKVTRSEKKPKAEKKPKTVTPSDVIDTAVRGLMKGMKSTKKPSTK